MREPKTIILTDTVLIGSHHLPPGTKVTLDIDRAHQLVEVDNRARYTQYDATALPPEPRLREMLVETTSVKPGTTNAAKFSGKAN